jgi:hypothetical protein
MAHNPSCNKDCCVVYLDKLDGILEVNKIRKIKARIQAQAYEHRLAALVGALKDLEAHETDPIMQRLWGERVVEAAIISRPKSR